MIPCREWHVALDGFSDDNKYISSTKLVLVLYTINAGQCIRLSLQNGDSAFKNMQQQENCRSARILFFYTKYS